MVRKTITNLTYVFQTDVLHLTQFYGTLVDVLLQTPSKSSPNLSNSYSKHYIKLILKSKLSSASSLPSPLFSVNVAHLQKKEESILFCPNFICSTAAEIAIVEADIIL